MEITYFFSCEIIQDEAFPLSPSTRHVAGDDDAHHRPRRSWAEADAHELAGAFQHRRSGLSRRSVPCLRLGLPLPSTCMGSAAGTLSARAAAARPSASALRIVAKIRAPPSSSTSRPLSRSSPKAAAGSSSWCRAHAATVSGRWEN